MSDDYEGSAEIEADAEQETDASEPDQAPSAKNELDLVREHLEPLSAEEIEQANAEAEELATGIIDEITARDGEFLSEHSARLARLLAQRLHR